MLRSSALALTLCLAACGPRELPAPPPAPEPAPAAGELVLTPLDWEALPGWPHGRDLAPALEAFRRSCAVLAARPDAQALNPRTPYAGTTADWREACAAAEAATTTPEGVAEFFRAAFTPVEASTVSGAATGMLTGYYEPEVAVRRQRDGDYTAPLRARPDDLLIADLGAFEPDLAGRRIVGMARGREFTPYRTRAEIEAEAAGEPLAWGRPIDVFFLQIQGSGRVIWPDGARARAAFAAHNGRPYRSIGRVLVDRGELTLDQASKAGIEAWLQRAGPGAARALFDENPRYAFFGLEPLSDPDLGPRGAAGIALTPMASVAVDPAFHPHGLPIWMEAELPGEPDWAGLVISQDAGGAILGPLRGDLFYGWGETAELRAGSTRAQARWMLLLPPALAGRLAPPPA